MTAFARADGYAPGRNHCKRHTPLTHTNVSFSVMFALRDASSNPAPCRMSFKRRASRAGSRRTSLSEQRPSFLDKLRASPRDLLSPGGLGTSPSPKTRSPRPSSALMPFPDEDSTGGLFEIPADHIEQCPIVCEILDPRCYFPN